MRYRNITVDTSINVSSSGHYSARVHFEAWQDEQLVKRYARWYGWGDRSVMAADGFYGELRIPNYVLREINHQLLAMLEGGEARFFEYDQERNKRYENLRYHSQENMPWLLEVARKRSNFGRQ